MTRSQEDIQSTINVAKNQVEVSKALALLFFADESVPLDVRWEMFEKIPEYLLNASPWIWEPEGMFINHSEELVYNREETVSTVKVVERMLESEYFTAEQVLVYKQAALAQGMGSFCYDW